MSDLPDYRSEFEAEVSKDGKLSVKDKGRWLGWLMRHAGKKVTLTLTREKRIRSLKANARYWSLVVPCFSEWSGYERDEAHEVLLQKFSSYEDHLPSGEVVTRIKRSSKMTVAEFHEYTSRVERFLAEHGFHVSDGGPMFPEAA